MASSDRRGAHLLHHWSVKANVLTSSPSSPLAVGDISLHFLNINLALEFGTVILSIHVHSHYMLCHNLVKKPPLNMDAEEMDEASIIPCLYFRHARHE